MIFVFVGDLTDESTVLSWLLNHLKKDEIEFLTDKMLDVLIQEKKHLAVLFRNMTITDRKI